MDIIKVLLQVQPENRPNCDQILKHPIILKKLEMFKCNDENEEATLLQTIRIPKNLLFLTEKLPQANYEKRIYKKHNSFTDENKESLPEIKNQKNLIRRKSDKISDKKYDIDIRESDKKENSEERKNNHDRISVGNYLPTQNAISEDNGNVRINNEQIIIPKKKRRIENNDRSLDNIISHGVYSNALNGSGIGSNNVKILKSENYEIRNNNSMLQDKSPYDESPGIKKKNKDLMQLPNIRHQQNYDNK